MMGEWRPNREMKVGREVQAEGSKCGTFIGWKRFKACKKWGVGGVRVEGWLALLVRT